MASTISSSFASHALQLLQKVQHGISPIELVYTAHERWPLRPGHTIHTRPTLHISVLDSSFNPPTLAHLALANSLPPQPATVSPSLNSSPEPYDARLLLLSVRNADKVLKPGDATFVQRLEMMRLFSLDIHSADTAEPGSEPPHGSGNVAVAIIDEPTFVGKSPLLLRLLHTRLATVVEFPNPTQSLQSPDMSYSLPSPKLTFLLGFDTFVRVFSPKYYPSEQAMVQMLRTFLSRDQEDCRVVCAHRRSATDKTLQEPKVPVVAREFISSNRIEFIDIGAEEQTYSSSGVRAKVVARDETWRGLVTDAIAQYIVNRGIYLRSEKEQ